MMVNCEPKHVAECVLYVHTHIHTHTHIYIYIYIERERVVLGRLLLALMSLKQKGMNLLENIICLYGNASGRTDGHAHIGLNVHTGFREVLPRTIFYKVLQLLSVFVD
jgi:hypothetical protein